MHAVAPTSSKAVDPRCENGLNGTEPPRSVGVDAPLPSSPSSSEASSETGALHCQGQRQQLKLRIFKQHIRHSCIAMALSVLARDALTPGRMRVGTCFLSVA